MSTQPREHNLIGHLVYAVSNQEVSSKYAVRSTCWRRNPESLEAAAPAAALPRAGRAADPVRADLAGVVAEAEVRVEGVTVVRMERIVT